MAEAVAAVATGAVTIASRDVQLNGVFRAEGQVARARRGGAGGGRRDVRRVVRVVLERLLAEPRGLLTLLDRRDPPPLEHVLSQLEAEHPELELDVHQGGQPNYPSCSRPSERLVSPEPVRVVIVEDNDTFRETLELLFGLRDEIEVVASVAMGDKAPPVVAELRPDVVLMDYRMPA